jgi:hypothetical protein
MEFHHDIGDYVKLNVGSPRQDQKAPFYIRPEVGTVDIAALLNVDGLGLKLRPLWSPGSATGQQTHQCN